MNRAVLNIWLRRAHLFLSLGIGVQVVIWLATGLFMTWFPIAEVRGEHLRRTPDPAPLVWDERFPSPAAALAGAGAVQSLTLTTLEGAPVWRLTTGDGARLIDAATGDRLDPIDEGRARRLAEAVYAGAGAVVAAEFFPADPPREYGRDGPAWRIDFGPADAASFYVDAATGEVHPVRTALWRLFDLMWGLHIMDWDTRENFNSWWIKLAATAGVLLAVAGIGIAALRVMRWAGLR